MVGCPLRCVFCPQDALRGQYGDAEKYLTVANFQRMIDKVPDHVRIDFSGMSEPWANPHATEMLRYTLEAGRSVAIYTTLYGMTDADGVEVAELLTKYRFRVEVLCIHLPDAKGNMRGWKYNETYGINLNRLAALRGTIPVELMTMNKDGVVHPDLRADGVLPEWVGHTRAGNVPQEAVGTQQMQRQPEHHTPVMCSFTPLYDQNVVLPNGDVVLCCMDYSMKHKIGNLLEQDYYDLFAGLIPLVTENMRPGFSTKSLCKSCTRGRALRLEGSKLLWIG